MIYNPQNKDSIMIQSDNNNQANLEKNQNNIDLRPNTHSFDTDLAQKYGIEIAIMLKHINYWVNYNKALNRNYHDGRYWFYNTLDEIAAHFEYWSKKQIERILKKMFDLKLILKGNYNKTSFDRTLWYTLNCQIDIPISGNGYPGIGTPIPNTNTNTKKESISKDIPKKAGGKPPIESKASMDIFEYFEDKYKEMRESRNLSFTKIKATKSQYNAISYLLKHHKADYIKKVIDKALKDDWWYKFVVKPSYLKTKFQTLETLLINNKANKVIRKKSLRESYEDYKKQQKESLNEVKR